ncbi:hypothetical protein GCM10009738_69820 [Kitasatospora viridis]|uniref:Uncharacterized protein n=2 Tax=Kitasatospora viridis TaxID=281105 RepID=A0A561UGL3_9ACTN|nr:hypothetical protein FHX73_112303 [Kitasatospora viridis]
MHVSDTLSSVGSVVMGRTGALLADPSPAPSPGSTKGNIDTIIGGIAPDWGPFSTLGSEARIMVEVVMAVAILACLAIAVWGAAKQRIGATALRDTFSAEQGKGLIVAGLTGVFIIGSLGTLFTIVYGMAI